MKRVLASVLVGFTPLFAFATTYGGGGVAGLLDLFKSLLNLAFPILISLAVVYFIFEVFRYTIAGDEEAKGKAKSGIIWGIVGIFVMVSIWGLVGILSATLGPAGGTGAPVINSPLPQ